MGVYHFAVFFFLFQIGMGVSNAMGVFPYWNTTISTGAMNEVVKYGESNTSYLTAGIDVAQAQTFGFGDYLFSMQKYVSIIYNAIYGIKETLIKFGFVAPWPDYIQYVAWFSYAGAIISFIANRRVADL